jgi:hypothetical protein
MGKKEIVSEALDWDQGIVPTFITLFSNPERVVMNPNKFTRPWKYATYVVSISCLFTWFLIHSFVETQDPALFWLTPRRMLELLTGYQNFYENTQPLKRLVLGAAAFYIALTIFLFKERKRMPGFFTVSMYLIGHSVFIVFILQTVGAMIVGRWNSNVVIFIGIVTHVLYLSYATIRILGKLKWAAMLFKGLGIFVVQFTLYNASSTRLVHAAYYGMLHRSEMIFRTMPEDDIGFAEKAIDTPNEKETTRPDLFTKEVIVDSLRIVSECSHPSQQEVAKITLRCFSKSAERWSVVIFEKINRYSPDPSEVLMKVDSASRSVFSFYRIANDSNSTIQIASVDIVSGKLNYITSLQPLADDVHLRDVAINLSSVYLVGSTQYKFNNFDLGMIAKIDKPTGKIISLQQLGSTSFASWTSIQQMKILPKEIQLVVKRDYKWMFLINKSSWSMWTINLSATSIHSKPDQ